MGNDNNNNNNNNNNVFDIHNREVCMWLVRPFEAVRPRAVRRRHGVGGGAPVNFGQQWRAASPKKWGAARRGQPKEFFLKIPEKNFSHLQNCLMTFF